MADIDSRFLIKCVAVVFSRLSREERLGLMDALSDSYCLECGAYKDLCGCKKKTP